MDRIWFWLLILLIFLSPLIMFRTEGEGIIQDFIREVQISQGIKIEGFQTLPHKVPALTNLLVKENFCQGIILILFYMVIFQKILYRKWKFNRSSHDIPILTLLIITGISLSWSPTQYISFRDWGLFASFLLFYYLILDQLEDIRKIKILLWAIVGSAIVTAFFSTCQHLQFYLWDFLTKAEDRNRMSATIGHNNGVASYMMMASFSLIALQYGHKNIDNVSKKEKFKLVKNLLVIFLLIWFYFVIMATLSRGVWIGTTVGLIILLGYLAKSNGGIQFFKRNWLKFSGAFVIILIFIAILSIQSKLNPLGVSVIQRFKDTVLRKETYLQDDRIRMWASSLEMIKEHPFSGVGFGAFKYLIPVYQGKYFEKNPNTKLEPTYKLTNQSHNEYIQTWAETGILGFLVAIWLIVKYLKIGVRLLKTEPENRGTGESENRNQKNESKSNQRISLFYISLFCATVGVLCQCLVDFPLHISPLALTFIFLGTIVVNHERVIQFQSTNNVKSEEKPLPVWNLRITIWACMLSLLCILTLIPLVIEIRSDWYKNRMDYYLDAAERFDPSLPEIFRVKALQKGIEYGLKSVHLDPHNARAHYELGLGYIKLQDIPNAIKHFEQATENMHYADLHFNLADAYEWIRRFYNSQGDSMKENFAVQKAIEHYKLAAYIYPLNKKLAAEAREKKLFYLPTQALHRLGVLLYQQGKVDEAIETWEKIARYDPSYLEDSYYKVAQEYRWKNDFATAIRLLEQAYSLDTTNLNSIRRLGAMYYEAGQYEKVIPFLDKVYETNSMDTNAVFGYAMVFDKLGEKEKAKEWVNQTLSLDSTHQMAKDMLKRLK